MDYKDDLKHKLPWHVIVSGRTPFILDATMMVVSLPEAVETVNRQTARLNELTLQIAQLKAQLRWSNDVAEAMTRDTKGLLRSIEQGVAADVVEFRLREIAAYGETS